MNSAISLSLIIPAYNEEGRLPQTLIDARVYLDGLKEPYEVIVVDDGSADSTFALAEAAAKEWPQLQALRLPQNTGKGAAVRAGMLRATGAQRIFSDADLSTPLEELPKLRAALSERAPVAIGSRALVGAHIDVNQPARRVLMGRTYNYLLRWIALPGIYDSQCGFKAFTALAAEKCFAPLHTLGFGFDAEVLLRARNHGWKITEVPVHWHHVEASRVRSFRDAPRMFVDLLRLRLRGAG